MAVLMRKEGGDSSGRSSQKRYEERGISKGIRIEKCELKTWTKKAQFKNINTYIISRT